MVADSGFRVPLIFDYVATFSWAASGAVVAIRKRFDIVGIFVVALLSSTGGGLIRDACFLLRVPSFLTNPVYLPLVAAATLMMAGFARKLAHILKTEAFGKLVDIIDALGIPAFAVTGMQLAEDQHIPIFGRIFIGIVNGVAGGLLRDIVVRDVPRLLRPGQFSSLTLAGACCLFEVLIHYDINPTRAAWAVVAAFFVVRLLTVRFNWQSRPILRQLVKEDSSETLTPLAPRGSVISNE